jgi:hypothetical protein
MQRYTVALGVFSSSTTGRAITHTYESDNPLPQFHGFCPKKTLICAKFEHITYIKYNGPQNIVNVSVLYLLHKHIDLFGNN